MSVARIISPKSKILPKLKVAAYCRISTRADGQQSSLVAQEHYYENHIKQNPSWVFVGVYSDIGSGTRIKGRSRFNALLSACKRGKIDMILTKSAHRFARNTVDALKTIRMLRDRNVDIYFEQEDIHSLYESSEFMLSLICARAQEESFSKARTSNGDCVNLSKIQIPSIINAYVMDIPMISKGNSLFMKDRQRLFA